MRGFTQNRQIGTALPLAVMNRIRRQNALEVILRCPLGQNPADATNYLGAIADVLEDKSSRGPLDHRVPSSRYGFTATTGRSSRSGSAKSKRTNPGYTVAIQSTTPHGHHAE